MVIKIDCAKSEGAMPNRHASSVYRALLEFSIVSAGLSQKRGFAAFLVKPGKPRLVALRFLLPSFLVAIVPQVPDSRFSR